MLAKVWGNRQLWRFKKIYQFILIFIFLKSKCKFFIQNYWLLPMVEKSNIFYKPQQSIFLSSLWEVKIYLNTECYEDSNVYVFKYIHYYDEFYRLNVK